MSWRDRLRPASFRGVPFHVEDGEWAGGRRVVVHEYPKRNVGFTEDMGRRQRSFRVRGYVIGSSYDLRARLVGAALEADGSGLLILPTQGEFTVVCQAFAIAETRELGGYATIDMDFVEEGTPAGAAAATDSASAVTSAADGAAASAANSPMAGIAN